MQLKKYLLEEVIEDAKKEVMTSKEYGTPVQFRNRVRIFNRLFKAIQTHTEEELLELLTSDFELFCVAFVRLDNIMPMYPALWQIEASDIVDRMMENTFKFSRKQGKSAFLTAKLLQICCFKKGELITIFAPTEGQLFVMQDIFKAIGRSSFLRDYFLNDRRLYKEVMKGVYNKENVLFGRTESEIIATNLNINQKSDTKRGGKGTIFVVDEYQMVPKDTMMYVVDEMMSDTYTRKLLIKTGTPSEDANPELQIEWLRSIDDDEVGTMHRDIWDGLIEGITSQIYVKKRFRKLRIPCPWGDKFGLCHKFLNERYGYKDMKPSWVEKFEDPEKYVGKFECNECCMLYDAFVAENLGIFPNNSSSMWFPRQKVVDCAREPYELHCHLDEPGEELFMGIDYGMYLNATQITVWEKIGDSAKMRFWEEILPVSQKKTDNTIATYSPMINRIKEIYHTFADKSSPSGNAIRAIYPDATAMGQPLTQQLFQGDNPIPRSAFYRSKAAREKGQVGIIMSGPLKAEMMIRFRELILQNRIIIPKGGAFFDLFVQELTHVDTRSSGGPKPYTVFKEPRGGSIDLLDATNLAMIHMNRKGASKAYFGFSGYLR